VVKNTLSSFHKLPEITAPEDKKTFLQLIINKITIKDKKDIDSIELLLMKRYKHISQMITKENLQMKEVLLRFLFLL